MNATKRIVIGGIGFRVGTNFSNQSFDIKILRIIAENRIEIFKIA